MRSLGLFFVCVLSILSSNTVFADTNAKTITDTEHYITAKYILDVKTGKWLEGKYLVVQKGKIHSIQNQIPGSGRLIDLGDHYLVPGLIDLHVHLTSDAAVHGYHRLSRSVPRAAIYGVKAAKSTLEAGFTTVRNLGAPGFADVALRDAINSGETAGPRMRVSGQMICITGGHCDGGILAPEYGAKSNGAANGPWEVKEKVRYNIKHGADVIKFAASGGVLSKGTDVNASQFSLEEMQALIEEAHDRGRIVAAHAHGANGIKRAIKAGVDSIEHASLIDEEGIRLAKKQGTTLVMDIYVSDYILSEGEKAGILEESLAKERQVGRVQRENFKKALTAGVNIAFGSDAGVYPHGLNGRQFQYMVDWGMSPLQALQSATVVASELLNWRDEQGRLLTGLIETGAFADLVVLKADPLKDISVLESPVKVIKGGELVFQRK